MRVTIHQIKLIDENDSQTVRIHPHDGSPSSESASTINFFEFLHQRTSHGVLETAVVERDMRVFRINFQHGLRSRIGWQHAVPGQRGGVFR